MWHQMPTQMTPAESYGCVGLPGGRWRRSDGYPVGHLTCHTLDAEPPHGYHKSAACEAPGGALSDSASPHPSVYPRLMALRALWSAARRGVVSVNWDTAWEVPLGSGGHEQT